MVDPNDMIDTIVNAIDYAEIAKDPQGLIKARRLLNNDLRQAIDLYVQAEIDRAAQRSQPLHKNGRYAPPAYSPSRHLSADSR